MVKFHYMDYFWLSFVLGFGKIPEGLNDSPIMQSWSWVEKGNLKKIIFHLAATRLASSFLQYWELILLKAVMLGVTNNFCE